MTTAVAHTKPTTVHGRLISGRQKIAIVCMAVGAEAAAKLTSGLSPDEAELVTYEIARMDRVAPETMEAVLTEWLESTLGVASLTTGGLEYAKEVLEKAYGRQRADSIMRRISSQIADTAGLHRLRKADPQQLATTLRGEHPQTAALVLAHLDTQHTAAILRELPTSFGGEVIFRMARMEKVAPEMLQLIERALSSEADLNFSQGMSAAGGPAAVANVLNLVSGTLEKELLEGVSERDASLCEQIKNLMFVFEDLAGLDDKSLQRLLREIEAKQLALALKAASDDLRDKIMSAMSQRAVGALKEEMEFMGPVKMRDVEAAQAVIVTQVRKLEESGEIVLTSGNGDDVLV
ncbi:flagellar motor switch protein FliG [Gemmatirosa kalamazoonensis]|uniref:Flagellar motor switch protein FliG n=1 Tax=Gemmatirosa kalamazoonensis TaxID=861299 RepID=W0RED5_9BACT|nr:flagellar motor switch protein FliG [Gemmatirosa kalamazoonensis]AHG87723.1 flagellar motor switch protein FliG [Gemmatirosa kalamazoonensis]